MAEAVSELAQRGLDLLQDGYGSAADIASALALFKEGHASGDIDCTALLGRMYSNAWGTPRNGALAFKLAQQAADAGRGWGFFCLGWCYTKGYGCVPDAVKAVQQYELASAQGVAVAKSNLGVCYDRGHGIPQDERRAFELYQEASMLGFAGATFKLGLCYERGSGCVADPAAAVRCFQDAAARNYTDAVCVMGEMYFFGQHMARNLPVALSFFERAASQQHRVAQFYMGYILNFCQPADARRFEEGARYLQLAAAQGERDAQFFLSECYTAGRGVPKSAALSRSWAFRAADQGSKNALQRLGRAYSGEHVTIARLKAGFGAHLPMLQTVLACAQRKRLALPCGLWLHVLGFLTRTMLRPPSSHGWEDMSDSDAENSEHGDGAAGIEVLFEGSDDGGDDDDNDENGDNDDGNNDDGDNDVHD